jgi:hypothetical protein
MKHIFYRPIFLSAMPVLIEFQFDAFALILTRTKVHTKCLAPYDRCFFEKERNWAKKETAHKLMLFNSTQDAEVNPEHVN